MVGWRKTFGSTGTPDVENEKKSYRLQSQKLKRSLNAPKTHRLYATHEFVVAI